LCSGQVATLDLATMTIDAFESLLPQKTWNEKTEGPKQPKMYVLEQSFLDQVQFMAGIQSNLKVLEPFQKVCIPQLILSTESSTDMQMAWLRSLVIIFDHEIDLILRSNGANLQVNQDGTLLANAIITCQNIKCLAV